MNLREYYSNLPLIKKFVQVLSVVIYGIMAIVLSASIIISNREVEKKAKAEAQAECEMVVKRAEIELGIKMSALEMLAKSVETSLTLGQAYDGKTLLDKLVGDGSKFTGAWIALCDSATTNSSTMQVVAKAGYSDKKIDAVRKELPKELTSGQYYISNPIRLVEGNNIVEVMVPLNNHGTVVGALGGYIKLNNLARVLETSHGFAQIIGRDGTVIVHEDLTNVGKISNELDNSGTILEHLKKEDSFGNFYYSETNRAEAYKYFTAFKVYNTPVSWVAEYVISRSDLMGNTLRINLIKFVLFIFGVSIALFLVYLAQRRFLQVIVEVSENIKLLSNGEIDKVNQTIYNSKDELGELSQSVNRLVSGLTMHNNFVREIAKGNLSAEITASGENDQFGNSIIEMKRNLVFYAEKEKERQAEEKIRTWKVEGLSHINETLRKHNHSLSDLTNASLREILGYVNAQQGGVFLINNDEVEPCFEMQSCIAFDRKRLLQKVVSVNEGLLGRCYFERGPVFLTELPQDYTEITSGLGDRRPDSLVIIPLINNDQMLGAIELASFKVFNEDEMDYILKASEALASSISNMLITERTKQLLEKSKQFAEEVGAQEEELRQNMEEMSANREEMERKTEEYEQLIIVLKDEIASLKGQNVPTSAEA